MMQSVARRTFGAAVLAVIVVGCSSVAVPAPASTQPTRGATASPIGSSAAIESAAPGPSDTPAPSVAALNVLWKKAGPIAGKTVTYWPAIDPKTGDIWVADGYHDRYWIFKPDGTFVESWGTSGSAPGQFNLKTHDVHPDSVGAIAFAPDGSFYVADVGNDRVEKFDANRRFVRQWGSFGTDNGQFTAAKGIATDGTSVFVADDGRGDMQVFDTSGSFKRSFPFPFVLFTLDPAGHLDVVNANQGTDLTEFDSNGTTLTSLDFSAAASAIGGAGSQAAVDMAGRSFIGLQDDTSGPLGMIELDPSGAVLHEWAGGFETIALAPDDSAAYLAYTGPPDGGWPYLEKVELPTP